MKRVLYFLILKQLAFVSYTLTLNEKQNNSLSLQESNKATKEIIADFQKQMNIMISIQQQTILNLQIKNQGCQLQEPIKMLKVQTQSQSEAIQITKLRCSNMNELKQDEDQNQIFITKDQVESCPCINDAIYLNYDIINNSDKQIDVRVTLSGLYSIEKNQYDIGVIVLVLSLLFFFYLFIFRKNKEQIKKEIQQYLDKLVPVQRLQEVFNNEKELSNITQCLICMREWQLQKDTVRLIPCQHLFHSECLEKWMIQQRFCPICTYSLTQMHLELAQLPIINRLEHQEYLMYSKQSQNDNITISSLREKLDCQYPEQNQSLKIPSSISHIFADKQLFSIESPQNNDEGGLDNEVFDLPTLKICIASPLKNETDEEGNTCLNKNYDKINLNSEENTNEIKWNI